MYLPGGSMYYKNKIRKTMYSRFLKKAGSLAFVGGIFYSLMAAEPDTLLTEDFLSNANFELADNLGKPVDWTGRSGVDFAIDTETKKEGNSSLKIWVPEDASGQRIVEQRFSTEYGIGEKLYYRVWVKYVDANARSGVQLVNYQAERLGASPWIGETKWTTLYAGNGDQEEWIQIEGEFDLYEKANSWKQMFYLQQSVTTECTLWVDNLEYSNYPFDGEVAVRNASVRQKTTGISINGNNVLFNVPTSYTLKLFTPNGKMVGTHSGFGKKVDVIANGNLASGCYMIKIQSAIGNLTQRLMVNNKN